MTVGEGNHELVEVSIAHDHELSAAAVDVSALAYQREQRRIDDQFLVFVRFRCRGSGDIVALPGDEFTAPVERHIAHGGREGEDAFGSIHGCTAPKALLNTT